MLHRNGNTLNVVIWHGNFKYVKTRIFKFWEIYAHNSWKLKNFSFWEFRAKVCHAKAAWTSFIPNIPALLQKICFTNYFIKNDKRSTNVLSVIPPLKTHIYIISELDLFKDLWNGEILLNGKFTNFGGSGNNLIKIIWIQNYKCFQRWWW